MTATRSRKAIRNPRSRAAHTIPGTIAFSRNEIDQAKFSFETALRFEPGYWEALRGLGVVYATRGDPARAIPLFEEVPRLRPGHAYASVNLERARDAVRKNR